MIYFFIYISESVIIFQLTHVHTHVFVVYVVREIPSLHANGVLVLASLFDFLLFSRRSWSGPSNEHYLEGKASHFIVVLKSDALYLVCCVGKKFVFMY